MMNNNRLINLLCADIADAIESGEYRIYDGDHNGEWYAKFNHDIGIVDDEYEYIGEVEINIEGCTRCVYHETRYSPVEYETRKHISLCDLKLIRYDKDDNETTIELSKNDYERLEKRLEASIY